MISKHLRETLNSVLLYRKDKLKKFNAKYQKKIKRNMGWCDDPSSKKYNQLVTFPFKKRAEKLFLKKNIYDLILVINFNTNPIIKNKGSAIFLHLANKKFTPTRGCIAIPKKYFLKILPHINKKTLLSIF